MSAPSLRRVLSGVSRNVPPVVLGALSALKDLGRNVVYSTQFVYHLLILAIGSRKTRTEDLT
jgi:hypothetical protein